MNIGDRVRLMTGKEEGIITRFLDNNLVEVAIDNDFTIPVMRREVVVIAAEEDKAFRPSANPYESPAKQKDLPPPVAPVLADSGFYAALVHQSDELLAITLINNTDFDILFTYGEEKQQRYRGVQNGKLGPRKTEVVGHVHLKDFDQWPALVFQYLQHRISGLQMFEPGNAKIQFKAASFYKSKKMAPVIKKEAYLYQIDAKAMPELDASKIKERMLAAPDKTAVEQFKVLAPAHEVDLHIEKLTENPAGMSNRQMLKMQLDAFQDSLDRAIAANMHEIVFIHGSGNGVLRQEIHKILSKTPEIKFYEDARKEKFGYGATLVKIK